MKERETLSKSHFMIIGQGVLEKQGVTDKHTWVEYSLLRSVKHHLTFLELFSNLLAYSYVSNNRVKLIIVLKGNSQIACKRVVANNRVERIFFGGAKNDCF